MNKTTFLLILVPVVCNNTINASDAARFANAAAADDQKTIIAILNDGFDVNGPLNAEGDTALHIAATHGHQFLVELLIMRGATVDSRNERKTTPLMRSDNSAVAKTLLRNRADVNAQNNDHETALMRAAQRGDVDTVKLLLEHRADVNVVTKIRSAAHGTENAFDYAGYAKKNKEKIRDLLKEAGLKGPARTRSRR